MQALIYNLFIFIFWYMVICLIVPAVVLRPYVRKKCLIERLTAYQIAGNCYLTLCSFLLAFLHFYKTLPLVFLLIILPICVRIVLDRKKISSRLSGFIASIKEHQELYGGYKLIARKIKNALLNVLKKIYDEFLSGNILAIIVLLIIAGFVIYFFGYYKAHNSGYGHTDEETHLYWIQSLLKNNAFPAGMYPHSTHFLVAAISALSGHQVISLWHFFSVFSILLILLMAYFYTRTLFRFRAPALFGIGFFVLTGIFQTELFNRFQYSLPMEFGFAGMFAMLVGLHLYITRRERFTWLLFIGGLFWTFNIHFYIAIFSVFLCIAYGIVYFLFILKQKRLHKVILSAVLAIVLGLVPFLIGLCAGFEFERSIDWAFSIMQGGDGSETLYEEDETDTSADDESSTENNNSDDSTTETTSSEGAEDEPVLTVYDITDLNLLTSEEIYNLVESSTTAEMDYLLRHISDEEYNVLISNMNDTQLSTFNSTYFTLYELSKIHSFSALTAFAERLLTNAVVRTNTQALFVYALATLALIYGIISWIIAKIKKRQPSRIGVLVFFLWFMSMVCHWMPLFYLPALLQATRAACAASLMHIPLFGFPVYIICSSLNKLPGKDKLKESVMIIVSLALLVIYYYKGDVKTIDRLYYNFAIQNADMDLCIDLIDNHKDFTWTIISPTNDLSVIRNNGYHYEIIDLIQRIEDGIDNIYIPTPDVYVVVEKRPVNFNLTDARRVDNSDFESFTSEIDPSYVNMSIYDIGINYLASRDRAYYDIRQQTMSKLYYWMEKFKEKYPAEYSVYSDDENVTVYHIHQDQYFLLNFAFDYSIEEAGTENE